MNSFIAGTIFCLTFGILSANPGISSENTPFHSVKDTSLQQKRQKELRVYNTIRLSTRKPLIDGILDDECWKTGNWGGNFFQWIPSEGGIPTFPTEFKVLYDDKNMYVAIRAYDNEPGKIQKYAGLRDELLGDMVGINFDSYHDHRTGFEFDMTAYGQKLDLVLSNPMVMDENWNPVWSGKVGFEDSAWIAEMEIPLNQLRYSNEKEQVWGMHVWRWIGRLAEEDDWEYQTLTGPGMLYNFGELRGIRDLKKSQRLEIMPYALGELKTFKRNAGNPFADKGKLWSGNMGLDVKVGISSNFTMDMTVNPDFGQVESDPSVMNLSAFETFYEEKRPFFLEAKNIFNYEFDDLNLFYSRRIGHSPSYSIPSSDSMYSQAPKRTTILSALKLSGKTSKGLSVGLLQSLTAPEHARLSDLDGNRDELAIEPLTNYMVARVQKDYHEGTTMIGGILTSANRFIKDKQLDFLSRDAYTGGLDLLHQWKDKKYFVDARAVGSYVQGEPVAIKNLQESPARYFQRPGASYLAYDSTRNQLSGFGGRARIGKGTGLWRYSTGVNWFSPGLELNDLGYMQVSDIITQKNEISYFVNQPVSIFRMYSVNLEQFNSWNFAGKYLNSGGHLSFNSEYKNKWGSSLNLILDSESLDTRILRGGFDMKVPYTLYSFGELRTDYSRRIFAELSYEYTQRGEKSANSFMLAPSLIMRPINTLKIGISANFGKNTDQLQYVTTLKSTPYNKYILGTVDQQTLGLTFRLDYSITPEFSLQYYGSPFVSMGSYSDYKQVINPLAEKYSQRFVPYTEPLNSPDFDFHEFRSNMVAKWEYRPGSFVYLVWSGERSEYADPVGSDIFSSMKQLGKLHPGNIFLIKFNYWFSI
jgi:hypothetical protein